MRRRSVVGIAAGLVLLAGLDGSASPVPPASFLDDFAWRMPDVRFGGFSAIELAADGLTFTAVSDRGAFTAGRITRDGDGRITAIAANPIELLQDPNGNPWDGEGSDSEGLAIAADGTAYVSFEGGARVVRYMRLDGTADPLPIPREFVAMQRNSALEALAIDAAGALYTLQERSGALTKPFAVYRFKNGKWDSRLQIPGSANYLPVAADFGPDGRFYLLERQFRGLAGFSSRLRRFVLDDAGFGVSETLVETPVGLHDNLEGMSIWRDEAGRLTATMVADDNFNIFLRSQIVEYRLPD